MKPVNRNATEEGVRMKARTVYLHKTLILTIVCGGTIARLLNASTNIDPTNKLAWTENTGWVNASPTNLGVTVHYNGTIGYLSGFSWGENIGWINMGYDLGLPHCNDSSANWGVNLDTEGNLSGYAWGENVGWIKFNSASNQVVINLTTGSFDGYAWGENIGWIHFKGTVPSYNVRTFAFDKQPQGTPNWWLTLYGFNSENIVGIKGTPVWHDFVTDTDPTNPASCFQITSISNISPTTVHFPSSSRRYYTLQRCANLLTGGWSNVTDSVQGTGGLAYLQDTNARSPQFYRIEVKGTP